MQNKWIIENPLKCNHITGTIAKSECGHYAITYNHKEQSFRLWFHSDFGYTLPLCSTSYDQFQDFNDHLIWFHQFIERKSVHDYYDLDQLPDPECTVKFKDNTCGACHHLIFKDYRHREGLCNLYRLHRCFDDRCKYEEEML